MKKITFIFAALAFTAGIAVISCTKEGTPTSQTNSITATTDAIQLDNSATEITGIIDDYQTFNSASFTDPTLKAGVAASPMSTKGMAMDNCATVTMTKTPVIVGGVVTSFTLKLTIDFGTVVCNNKDGKQRKGTITSTYTWVKLGGWSRESAIDLYVNDVHHVGTETSTFGVIGPNHHAYFTENTTLTVTAKDGASKIWTSERQRELIEGNGGGTTVKIYKITGKSTFTNAKGDKSTYTITVPLIKPANCKSFTEGTIVTLSTAGVTTTIDYGTGTTCKDGYTVKAPGDKDGKGIVNTVIKWAK